MKKYFLSFLFLDLLSSRNCPPIIPPSRSILWKSFSSNWMTAGFRAVLCFPISLIIDLTINSNKRKSSSLFTLPQAASYMLFFRSIPQLAPMWKVVVVIALNRKLTLGGRQLSGNGKHSSGGKWCALLLF